MVSTFKRILAMLPGLALVAAFQPGPALAAGETSAYTTIDFERDCIAVSDVDSESGSGGSWLCAGYKGWPVHVAAGDLRESVFFGHLGPWFADADGGHAFATFGMFNGIGRTVEWRLDDKGAPFAAILRFHLDSGDPAITKRQVLVVSTVGQPGIGIACIAGYVDATDTPKANEVARAFADQSARDFKCGGEEAFWHGVTSDPPPDVSTYYPGARDN
jgi:hypothetical protein